MGFLSHLPPHNNIDLISRNGEWWSVPVPCLSPREVNQSDHEEDRRRRSCSRHHLPRRLLRSRSQWHRSDIPRARQLRERRPSATSTCSVIHRTAVCIKHSMSSIRGCRVVERALCLPSHDVSNLLSMDCTPINSTWKNQLHVWILPNESLPTHCPAVTSRVPCNLKYTDKLTGESVTWNMYTTWHPYKTQWRFNTYGLSYIRSFYRCVRYSLTYDIYHMIYLLNVKPFP